MYVIVCGCVWGCVLQRLCVCVCVDVHICVCVCMLMRLCTCENIHTSKRTYNYFNIPIHTCKHKLAHTHYFSLSHTHAHTHIHTQTQAQAQVHPDTHIYAHRHTQMRTCTKKYTHTRFQLLMVSACAITRMCVDVLTFKKVWRVSEWWVCGSVGA